MASHAMAPSLIKIDAIGEGVDIGLTRVGTRRAQVNKDHARRGRLSARVLAFTRAPSLVVQIISSLSLGSFRLSRLNQETTQSRRGKFAAAAIRSFIKEAIEILF